MFGRLVFCLAMGVATVASATPCDVPPTLENRKTVVDGDVEVTIASERATYEAGDTITIYIVYKNMGADTLRFERNNSPMHGFSVLPETCTSSRQAGCDALLLFQFPRIVHPTTDAMELPPGECHSWSYAWNGRTNDVDDHQLLGQFTVLGGVWAEPVVLYLHDYSLPGGGAPLGIEIGATTVQPATWGRVRTLFR